MELNIGSYKDYLNNHPFHHVLNIDLAKYGDLERKVDFENYDAIKKKGINPNFYSVEANLKEAHPAELDDLIRLHYLITSRKVTTVLEFGVGKSSIVIDHALQFNKENHSAYVKENLRRTNAFECFSVDNDQHWINICKKTAKTLNVNYQYSKCIVSTFNGRICTYYETLPNICPDFIYVDGPGQFSPIGDVRGVSTNHPDRLPMSADILAIEHFLLPGTLIVVDGRSANARFLKSNLQRGWSYSYSYEYNQHFFELTEKPLGKYNKRQIDYCLGKDFYSKVSL